MKRILLLLRVAVMPAIIVGSGALALVASNAYRALQGIIQQHSAALTHVGSAAPTDLLTTIGRTRDGTIAVLESVTLIFLSLMFFTLFAAILFAILGGPSRWIRFTTLAGAVLLLAAAQSGAIV